MSGNSLKGKGYDPDWVFEGFENFFQSVNTAWAHFLDPKSGDRRTLLVLRWGEPFGYGE